MVICSAGLLCSSIFVRLGLLGDYFPDIRPGLCTLRLRLSGLSPALLLLACVYGFSGIALGIWAVVGYNLALNLVIWRILASWIIEI